MCACVLTQLTHKIMLKSASIVVHRVYICIIMQQDCIAAIAISRYFSEAI